VLRGPMGTGKTKIGQYMRSILGRHYVLVSDPRYVTGQFNSHVVGCLLLHADEAFWAGDRKVEGRLKDLVTGDSHFVEFKGREPYPVPNHLRFMVSGNPDWLAPAGMMERRFATFDVGSAHQEDHAYFAKIDEEMRNGGGAALLQYFLELDISGVNLRTIPMTQTLIDQKLASMSSEQSWWLHILLSGVLPSDFQGVGLAFNKALYEHYIENAKAVGVGHRSSEPSLGRRLKEMAGFQPRDLVRTLWHSERRQAMGVEYRGTRQFPTLAECRAKFNLLCPGLPPWGEPTNWMPDGNFSVTDPELRNDRRY
jgi:hypothetical protein